MTLPRLVLMVGITLIYHGSHHGSSGEPTDGDIADLKRMNTLLSRQLMQQQLFNEERIRSDGNSGIKAKRHRNEGMRPYYSDSYTGLQYLTVHDHANYKATVGMGEFVAVLNGVEFRTRHNDYSLYRPSTTSEAYHATEEIPLPDVPPEVLTKSTVKDQIDEMRLWFKAFKDMDKSQRNYTKYFKPVLCYLEGAWTETDPDNEIDEPFVSERHTLNAVDWNELHRKIRFSSYSGAKDNKENIAFLPTTLLDMKNDTIPVFAQWNYRIMCHPMSKYLERDRLRVVDDLAPRMAFNRDLENHAMSRSARFQVNSVNKQVFKEGFTDYTLVDELMGEVPGKNNYPSFLKDEAFGMTALDYFDGTKTLNAGRYHRWYQVKNAGANGRQHLHRSFFDKNVFMALNTQPKIVQQTVNDDCTRSKRNGKHCASTYKQRWSYAIPLEIVYLTPLGKWNPYDIGYEENKKMGNRKGGMTKATAFDGNNKKIYYRTPTEFYTTGDAGKNSDAADTSGKSVGVLNKKGDVKAVMASGVHITLPEIDGVGVVRTRFPIAPVHQEGEALWKEVQALRDLILVQTESFKKIRDEFGLGANNQAPVTGMDGHRVVMSMAFAPPHAAYGITAHTHTVTISPDDIKKLKAGSGVDVTTNIASQHSHRLTLKYDKDAVPRYFYVSCDGETTCWDYHSKEMRIQDN